MLDIDIAAVSLSGAVTLNGSTLPNVTASISRGDLTFARASGEGGGSASIALGNAGAASYAITAVPGAYVISHTANAALCTGAAAPEVPCASQVILGCP